MANIVKQTIMKNIKTYIFMVIFIGSILTVNSIVNNNQIVNGVENDISIDQETNSTNEIAKNEVNQAESIPSISLSTLINDTAHQSGTKLKLNIEDNNGLNQVLYNWNTGNIGNSTLSSPFELTLPKGDGMHFLNVYAQDTEDNWGFERFLFTIDDTNPSISLYDLVNNTVYQPGYIVSLDLYDANGFDQILYNWDGVNGKNHSLMYHVPETTISNVNGLHTLSVYAQDSAGNWMDIQFVFTTDDSASS